MASLLDVSPMEGGQPGNLLGKELMDSPFFKNARMHSKSQDVTADLIELSNVVHNAPAPMVVGEMLVRKYDMMAPSKRIRIRDRGKAVKTGRGNFSRGRGSKTRFVTLQPELEIEDHESWDRNYLEDADWDVAMEESGAIAQGHKELCSQVILNRLDSIAQADTASGALFTHSTGDLTLDIIIDMHAQMNAVNVNPNALVLHTTQGHQLLKDDDFKDIRLYGEFTDKSRGFIGRIFDMDIYQTTQLTSRHGFMLDTNEVLAMGVRRDGLMESYQETQDGKTEYGIKISTRYDLKEIQPKFILRSEALGTA
jgi:hypothetical protein